MNLYTETAKQNASNVKKPLQIVKGVDSLPIDLITLPTVAVKKVSMMRAEELKNVYPVKKTVKNGN